MMQKQNDKMEMKKDNERIAKDRARVEEKSLTRGYKRTTKE
jgi:hypothetical protein